MFCTKNDIRIFRGVYLLVSILIFTTAGSAQIHTSFSFGTIGNSTGTLLTSSGGAILIKGKSTCLKLESGLVTMAPDSALGIFSTLCEEKPPVGLASTIELTVYPNPTNGSSWLKAVGYIDPNMEATVRVITITGNVVIERKVSSSAFQGGYLINLASNPSGAYIVSLDMGGRHYEYKLIKGTSL
jgi:hypothetical protein